MSDIIGQAMGFSPASNRAARDRLSVNIRKDQGRQARSLKILDKIIYGLENGREELVSEGIADMAEYNKDHPTRPLSIDSIKRSMSGRQRRSESAILTGGAPVERNAVLEMIRSNREFEEGYD